MLGAWFWSLLLRCDRLLGLAAAGGMVWRTLVALCRCGCGCPALQPMSQIRAAGMAPGSCAMVAWPVQVASIFSFAFSVSLVALAAP